MLTQSERTAAAGSAHDDRLDFAAHSSRSPWSWIPFDSQEARAQDFSFVTRDGLPRIGPLREDSSGCVMDGARPHWPRRSQPNHESSGESESRSAQCALREPREGHDMIYECVGVRKSGVVQYDICSLAWPRREEERGEKPVQ